MRGLSQLSLEWLVAWRLLRARHRDGFISVIAIISLVGIALGVGAVLSLAPWSQGVPRAIREGQKIYLYDFPRVPDPEARFENMVALELCRAVSNWNETGYGRFNLHFIRTKDQQEVDFLLSDDGRPVLLVDARPQELQPSAALLKFQAALRVPAVHLVQAAEGYRRVANDGHSVLVAPACQYLAGLP